VKNLTKKQKQQAAAGLALLGLLLLWRVARAKTPGAPVVKTPPRGVVTIGPITVEDTEADAFEPLRQKRASYRNRVLDLIGFDEDAWQPTRRPTTADLILVDGLLSSLAGLRYQIPDPEGFDAGFDADLTDLVRLAKTLDPSTSDRPAQAFGSSRYMTRRLAIEEEIRDLVAMTADRKLRRRPTDAEMIVIARLMTEYDALGDKLKAIDEEAELYDEPLRQIVAQARALPPSSSSVPPSSAFIPGSMPVA
jgi:hypothetical protein